jgi:hypothetical protein
MGRTVVDPLMTMLPANANDAEPKNIKPSIEINKFLFFMSILPPKYLMFKKN